MQMERMRTARDASRQADLNGRVARQREDTSRGKELSGIRNTTQYLEENGHGGRDKSSSVDGEG